jgi:capsular exopolysaccharide synthesis family protein
LSATKNSSIVDVNDLKFIWRVISKNWYIPLIAISVFAGAGYLYSYKLTDIYAAKSQILLKSNVGFNTSSIISDNFYGGGGASFIDNSNETRVISSYDLVKKVLDRLDFDVSYFIVGRIRTVELFDGLPYKVKAYIVSPELYEQQIKFRILDQEKFEITYLKGNVELKKVGFFDREFTDTDFRLLVTKNPMINPSSVKSLKEVEYLIQIHNHDALVYRFQTGLVVSNPDYTNVLETTLEDVLPQRAVVFLDTLSEVYIENTLKSKFEVNNNTLRFIDKQMGDVTAVLNEIEDTMQGFKEKNSILNLDKETEKYYGKLTKFDDLKADMKLRIASLNDLENYIITNKDPEFLPPSLYFASGDNYLGTASNELYSLQLSRSNALSVTKEGSPSIKDADRRIETLKKNLLIYIGNARGAMNQKITDSESEIKTYTSDIKALPSKQKGLLNIQRKLSVNENMYLFLLQKRSNTFIAKASIIPETKVIEAARSIGLIKPNRKKILNSYMMFGGVFGVMIILIRSVFFARIESVDELKAKTPFAVIGEVIFAKMENDLIIAAESEPKSPIAESFRTIRTNLQYMVTKGSSKVIVITSNSPGEGKTFCTLNLAGILAKAGKKVLILELDLHKPRVQKGLNLEADIGISTIVIGKNTIVECVKHTQIENLDVILSGPLPPNPSEIILTTELESIITYGRENYEYVIIDTPPVGLISDAIVLMKMSDISLFVINTRFPFKDSLNNANEIVGMNKLVHFAFILNEVKRRKSKYYYNRYGYAGYGNYGGYGSYGGYGKGYGGYKNG